MHEMRNWCVLPNAATRELCQWVIYTAGEACLPDGHAQLLWSESQGCAFPVDACVPDGCVARDPVRAYWITLSDYAVKKLIAVMEAAEFDVQEAAATIRSQINPKYAGDDDSFAGAAKGKGKGKRTHNAK